MTQQVEAKIREYIHKYQRENGFKERENICKEVGLYLSNVSEGIEFNHFASMFICGIHEQHPVNPTPEDRRAK